MNLIPKRRFEGNPTVYGGTIQRTITEFKKLNIGTAQITDLAVTNAKIGLLAVDTAQIAALAVEDAKINDCSISKLTVGNIAVVGTLTTGGYLKSTNYVADTSGWQIDYLGNAEFNSVKVRGSIYTSSIVSGNTLTVSGTISAGAGGVLLDTSGVEVIGEGQMIRFFATAPTGTPRALLQSTTAVTHMTTNSGDVGLYSAGDILLSATTQIFVVAATGLGFGNVAYMDLPRTSASTPPTAATARFWYDTTNNVIKYYNGTAWKTIATV